MLVLEWKKRAFIEKVNSRCFRWFPAAILVHQNGTPTWRLHTKLYKGAWNVSANNSETVGHKDLRLGQIVYILVFYNIHFLGFFHWTVSNLFFCCLTVKTIYIACEFPLYPRSKHRLSKNTLIFPTLAAAQNLHFLYFWLYRVSSELFLQFVPSFFLFSKSGYKDFQKRVQRWILVPKPCPNCA